MYKVTVITPTTKDRAHFMPNLMRMYSEQDYPLKEMLIIHDFDDMDTVGNMPGVGRPDIAHLFTSDTTVGAKLNFGCQNAQCDIIVRMDSDDMYDPQWISRSVAELTESGADVTGLSNAYFLNSIPELNIADIYEYYYNGPDDLLHVCGATMCLWKETWKKHQFNKVNLGEDQQFCRDILKANGSVHSHNKDRSKFCAAIHGKNTASEKQMIHMRKFNKYEQDKINDFNAANNSIGKLMHQNGYL